MDSLKNICCVDQRANTGTEEQTSGIEAQEIINITLVALFIHINITYVEYVEFCILMTVLSVFLTVLLYFFSTKLFQHF